MILLRRCCTLIIVKNSATHIYRGFCNHCNFFSIVTYTNCYEVITGFSLFCFKRTPTLFLRFQANLQIIFSQHTVSVKLNILFSKIPFPLLSWTSPGLCGTSEVCGKELCYVSYWMGDTGCIWGIQYLAAFLNLTCSAYLRSYCNSILLISHVISHTALVNLALLNTSLLLQFVLHSW